MTTISNSLRKRCPCGVFASDWDWECSKCHRTNLIGRRFGKLVPFSKTRNKKGSFLWLCKCECGKSCSVSSYRLTSGWTKSCGCLRVESLVARTYKHGKSNSREFRIWAGMISRCSNKNHKDFIYYGGRGIRVSRAWMSFQRFYKDMGRCPAQFTIERIDNDGDYEKKNCKWASRKEQSLNTRRNCENRRSTAAKRCLA